MIQTRSLVWLALSGLLAAAFPALAEDFEFEVPVQLSKLDPVFTEGRVSCHVVGVDRESPTTSKRANAPIASGSASFALVQGAFNGTVSVKFDADRPRRQPADARAWTCLLAVVAPSGSEPLCFRDSTTGMAVPGKFSPVLNLDPQSVKGCTQGTIASPK